MRLAGISLLAAALCAASCSLFGPEAPLSLIIPAPPAHWTRVFPELAFLIVFPNAAGSDQTVMAEDWRAPIVVSCSKAGNSPVLAYPCTSRDAGPGLLRPAGGLYAVSLAQSGEAETLALSWQDGALAYLLSRLRSLGSDVSLVNTPRLRQYLGNTPDPWALDLDGMAERLAKGDFAAHDIDALAARDVQLRLGSGAWFLESPFAAVVTPDLDGVLVFTGVPIGMHGLYSIDGSMARIYVGKTGTVMVPRQ